MSINNFPTVYVIINYYIMPSDCFCNEVFSTDALLFIYIYVAVFLVKFSAVFISMHAYS
jgi:hypothetical protein